MNPLLAQLVASSDHGAIPEWPLLCNDSNIRKLAVYPAICQKTLKISVSVGSYLKLNSVDAKAQTFQGWGHSRSLGTPCPLAGTLPTTLLGHAATARKAWTLLPMTTKPVETPRPQHCDSFRVSKKGETQLVVQGNARIESSSPKVADGGKRLGIIRAVGTTGWV